MAKILFVPLNTNHVNIFHGIIKLLTSEYDVLCYDKICNSEQFYTENILKTLFIPYSHLPETIHRTPHDNTLKRIINFFKIKGTIKTTLKQLSPAIVVIAIDSDPISQVIIHESRNRGIKTILLQEALMRPQQYIMRKKYISTYLYKILRSMGIYLNYIQYGTGNCDRILVSGKTPMEILHNRGVPKDKMVITGFPKYDTIVEQITCLSPLNNKQKICLFAASTTVISDDSNITFLNLLVEATNKLGIYLIIKLHPRSPLESKDIYNILSNYENSLFEIIKEGDDTFAILKRSDILITVSSTVLLEALMMDKECITVNYLAGENCLDYRRYDAIHSIENKDEIYEVLKNCFFSTKDPQKKKKLLEDELYKMDGQSSQRAANYIENMLHN